MHIVTRVTAATALTLSASWLGGCAPATNGDSKPLATITAPVNADRVNTADVAAELAAAADMTMGCDR